MNLSNTISSKIFFVAKEQVTHTVLFYHCVESIAQS